MDLDKAIKLFEQWKTLLVTVGFVLTAILGLWTQVLTVEPWAWSWPELLFTCAVVLVPSALLIRDRVAKASRWANSEPLRLNPQSPEQLIGRSQDLDELLTALSVYPLVFLTGESGCGKSAFLRVGVQKSEIFRDRFLPIYIDMSNLDWEEDPLRILREEFSRRGGDAGLDGRGPKLDKRSGPRTYSEVLAKYCRSSGRRPLFLLDQFDDYQAQPKHRTRFLHGGTDVWRSANSIARENLFWRVLGRCLHRDAASLVSWSLAEPGTRPSAFRAYACRPMSRSFTCLL
jgi:hypothetical protein